MSMKDRTKWMLAHCLEDMLKTKRLEDIRVSDLCKKCDIKRQIFYYHFKDKYDLAAWLFIQDMKIVTQKSGETFLTSIINVFKQRENRHSFYLKILENFEQNYVKNYIYNYNVTSSINLVKEYYGIKEVNKEMVLSIRFYTYGAINTTFDWLAYGCEMTAEEIASYQYHMMPDFLKEAYSA